MPLYYSNRRAPQQIQALVGDLFHKLLLLVVFCFRSGVKCAALAGFVTRDGRSTAAPIARRATARAASKALDRAME